jgi:hypothetical protein
MSKETINIEPLLPPPSDFASITFNKNKSNGLYTPSLKQNRTLRNSLLIGVGFLELANAGDFAANLFNQVPPPHFAIALMAVGATLALSISYFAFADLRLSWQNVMLLREERHYLRASLARCDQDVEEASSRICRQRELTCLLDVNFRELGTEAVDRVGMDCLMGFSAIVTGVGTFLAIGGANPRVYRASNLLSGYIGNTPSALYGVLNAVWSIYTWRRARRHGLAGTVKSEWTTEDTLVEGMLKRRTGRVKMHAVLNGLTGLVGAAAGLVSATMWEGYVFLAPCVVSAIYCNYVWRHWLGYDRPSVQQVQSETKGADKSTIVAALQFVSSAQDLLTRESSSPLFLHDLVADDSIASMLRFISRSDMFEDFCTRLLNSDIILSTRFRRQWPDEEDLVVDSQRLLALDVSLHPRILEIAQTCFREKGSLCLTYRERYLLELLGCCISIAPAAAREKSKEEA